MTNLWLIISSPWQCEMCRPVMLLAKSRDNENTGPWDRMWGWIVNSGDDGIGEGSQSYIN